MTFLRSSILFLLLAIAAQAADLRVATLNCYLLFAPGVEHAGKLDEKEPLTPEQYRQKLTNLIGLVKEANFVGLEETGGRAEIEALAAAGGYQWAFAKGRDTYTGEEVGALYRMPGWRVTVQGRVGELDKILSKHLLVTATQAGRTVRFLVVHLLRPIGKNAEKHQQQLAAISQWADGIATREPTAQTVILGDTNDTTTTPGTSLFGAGQEAGELLGFAGTHLTGKPFDRLVLVGPGSWSNAVIARPPYGKKPNDQNKRLWTDHFVLEATLNN